MIHVKDKVTHPEYGVGTVEHTYRQGRVIEVDFKGQLKVLGVNEVQKGANTYTPKKSFEEKVIKQQVRLQKVCKEWFELYEDLMNRERPSNEQAIRALTIKKCAEELENILKQGL